MLGRLLLSLSLCGCTWLERKVLGDRVSLSVVDNVEEEIPPTGIQLPGKRLGMDSSFTRVFDRGITGAMLMHNTQVRTGSGRAIRTSGHGRVALPTPCVVTCIDK